MIKSIAIAVVLLGLASPLTAPVRDAGAPFERRLDTVWQYAQRYRIPTPLAARIIRAADRYLIPRQLAFRMVRRESGFDSLAMSSSGALGLLQVLPSTARDLRPGITPDQLLEVGANLDIGFAYLSQLQARYDGDRWLALVAYNDGMVTADSLQDRFEYTHGLVKR